MSSSAPIHTSTMIVMDIVKNAEMGVVRVPVVICVLLAMKASIKTCSVVKLVIASVRCVQDRPIRSVLGVIQVSG